MSFLKKTRLSLLFQQKFYSKKVEKRNPNFATINDKDLTFFEKILTKTRCITDPQLLDSYNIDWLRITKGKLINL